MFEMAFPGVNWRKLTIATFYARFRVIPRTRATLDGTYTTEMNDRIMRQKNRKELFTRAKFPSFFQVEF